MRFRAKPPDVFVLVLDLRDHRVAIPEHLEAEFQLVLHLREHVVEGVVGRAQQLECILAGLEDRPEGHRNDRMVAHHGLVDVLVSQHVLARRIERANRHIRHDRREIPVVDGVNAAHLARDRAQSELQRLVRPDDAIDVFAPVRAFSRRRQRLGLAEPARCHAAVARSTQLCAASLHSRSVSVDRCRSISRCACGPERAAAVRAVLPPRDLAM